MTGKPMNATTAAPPDAIRRRDEPTWELVESFPRQGHWTECDYLALDTNRMVELSDGYLEVLPMPGLDHQFIVRCLFEMLNAFVKTHRLGETLFAPLPVRLWPGKLREPDVVFLRHERLKDRRGQPDGADLVIEAVSEGIESRNSDLVTKRAEYAKAGIAEYWIVDPEQRQICVLTLDVESYRVHGEFKSGQRASSVLLSGFTVDVDDVWVAAE